MPNEIIQGSNYSGPIHVWHCDSYQYPSVTIGTGPFTACLRPHEARELAHALVEAANEATRPHPYDMEVAS